MASLSPVYLFLVLSVLLCFALTIESVNDCWPRQLYGLPKAGVGCPGSCDEFVWEEGYRLFLADYANSTVPNLPGIFLQNETLLQFCMKSSTYQCLQCPVSDWPDGSYCIYRHKKQDCPPGFMPGSVTFNATRDSNRNGGSIPAGVYTQNYTMLTFCCKESSISRSVDIVLPRNRAFYLMAAQNRSCQSVKDMEASEETLAWSGVSVTVNGTVPKALGNNTLELTFCYYTPSPATVEQATEPEDPSRSDVGIPFTTVLAAVVPVVALLAIAMVSTAMVIGACTYKRKQKTRKTGGGEGHYEDIVADISPADALVPMSTSLQHPKFVAQSSSVDAVHVHQAPSQLHSSGVTPAAAAQYMSEGVTSTNDITMEDNPAY